MFLFFLCAIAITYAYGWHQGVLWLKKNIERECNVTIDDHIVITRKDTDGENV